MEIKQNVNIHNRFDVHVDNIETGEHREFVGYNIILDQMWTRLCTGNSYFSHIHFGTGTGTPTPDRTSLFSHLGTKSASTEETIKAFPVSSWKRKIVLNPEEYVGRTITEVGIAYGSSASNLVTHAMLKDSEGNPISITKTSTDVVTIYATVFITLVNAIPELKWIGTPRDNQLINYLTGGSAPSGSFRLSTIENPSSSLGTTATVTWTSDVPNRKRKTNIARFGTTSGNGHVKYLGFTDLFRLKLPAPGIFSGQPYTGVNVGSGDGVKKSFMLPSANIRQSSLVIKKNGLTVSDYTTKIKNLESNSRIADPASLPTDSSSPTYGWGVALTPDGTVMAVVISRSPYVATYDWVEGAWVKRSNPTSLPRGEGNGVALNHDGTVMAVAHDSSPYITTYDWVDGAWVKRPDPASLPTGTGKGVSLTADGTFMAVAHSGSSRITTYDWINGAWVKRPDPASLPTNYGGEGVALTPDGTVMAVAHYNPPYVTTYMGLPFTQITFDTPPALGDAITADYIVDGVHKTDQYVIDVSFAIQFGEGV